MKCGESYVVVLQRCLKTVAPLGDFFLLHRPRPNGFAGQFAGQSVTPRFSTSFRAVRRQGLPMSTRLFAVSCRCRCRLPIALGLLLALSKSRWTALRAVSLTVSVACLSVLRLSCLVALLVDLLRCSWTLKRSSFPCVLRCFGLLLVTLGTETQSSAALALPIRGLPILIFCRLPI